MNREESLAAMEAFARSPAAKWIGNRLERDAFLQKCTRCGAEARLPMPPALATAYALGARGDDLRRAVPPDFDDKLFRWKRDFQIAHEGCGPA